MEIVMRMKMNIKIKPEMETKKGRDKDWQPYVLSQSLAYLQIFSILMCEGWGWR